MADIRVRIGQENDIKVRVGQENAVKVISSLSGSSGRNAVISENVIGGIASVRQLYVSGISTFVGIASFSNNVYINGSLVFIPYPEYGVAYFNNFGQLVSAGSSVINESNLLLTTNMSGVPTWTNIIDGGTY